MSQGFFRGIAIGLGVGLGGVTVLVGITDLPVRLRPAVPPLSAPITEVPVVSLPTGDTAAPDMPMQNHRGDDTALPRLAVPGASEPFLTPNPRAHSSPVGPNETDGGQRASPSTAILSARPATQPETEVVSSPVPRVGITAQEAIDPLIPKTSAQPGAQPRADIDGPALPTAPLAPFGPDASLYPVPDANARQSPYFVTHLAVKPLSEPRPVALIPQQSRAQNPMVEVTRPQFSDTALVPEKVSPDMPVMRKAKPLAPVFFDLGQGVQGL